MSKDTITKLQEVLNESKSLESPRKEELAGLINALKVELSLTKEDQNETVITGTLKDLEDSVQEFEVSHPKLVSAVNSICAMFASMGI